jgi:SnoaL-like domain
MNLSRRRMMATVAGAVASTSVTDPFSLQNTEAEEVPGMHSQIPVELVRAIEQYNAASRAFMNGDSKPLQDVYSHSSDVTIFGGFGGYEHGWNEQVQQRLVWASARFRGGDTHSENISLIVTPELACSVDLEHEQAQLAGVQGSATVDLRVTTVFRREGPDWKVVHRHADPLLKVQEAGSVVRK